MELFLFLGLPILFLVVLGGVGWARERAHIRRLGEDESSLSHIIVTNTKTAPAGKSIVESPFVIGEAVIGSDYLKTALASLRAIVGGEVKSFQTLLDRGRREAMVRMLRKADAQGATAVINVRVERAEMGNAQLPAAEIIATGTAVR